MLRGRNTCPPKRNLLGSSGPLASLVRPTGTVVIFTLLFATVTGSHRSRRAPGPHRTSPSCPLRLRDLKTATALRSEEHTSELQSRQYLVCRLLLEKKKEVYCATTSIEIKFRLFAAHKSTQ